MQETPVWFLGREDPWRKDGLPTPVCWPREFHGLYRPCGCKELETTEQLSLWFSLSSHLYMLTWKTIALPIQIFVNKVMSLLSNMLSRFVITFLPRIRCFLISWLQSLSAVILESKKRNYASFHCFTNFLNFFCDEVLDQMPWSSLFWMLTM